MNECFFQLKTRFQLTNGLFLRERDPLNRQIVDFQK